MSRFERELSVDGQDYSYFSLDAAQAAGMGTFSTLPFSLKVLAENLLRHGVGNEADDELRAVGAWVDSRRAGRDLSYRPARVIMPEIGGLPLLIDLCAMRDAVADAGGDPNNVNPLVPVDLIVDHSVVVDVSSASDALDRNMAREFERNEERYRFLKWAQSAFRNLRLVPPGNGILHQINLEYLATVVSESAGTNGQMTLHPDCLIGMDSHTPMINALGIFGWGVGGVEAGAAMLGQPVSLRLPEVVGCRLHGSLRSQVTATDLVLVVVEALRRHGVVQKFVEFCGDGLDGLNLPDRATLSNMAPEYGATMGYMPIDAQTLDYLRMTGRSAAHVARVESYTQAQGLWRESGGESPVYSSVVDIDLDAVMPGMAGPFRPNQHVSLPGVPAQFAAATEERKWRARSALPTAEDDMPLHDGMVALAAITSCTNTSNSAVMLGAGLLARNARERGLEAKAWVKRSLAPGSRVVADYLAKAGLQQPLDELGFNVVGFGCTTCMGNSGDISPRIAQAVRSEDLIAVAVLSGNRNFEGRVHPECKAAFLGSPLLVVAYAIAGTIHIDFENEPLGVDPTGAEVYLRDLWPTREEVDAVAAKVLGPALFSACYAPGGLFEDGTEAWQTLTVTGGERFGWSPVSDYLIRPPYFENYGEAVPERAGNVAIANARALLIVGDAVTTDHISPVSVIPPGSEAGRFLAGLGVAPADFSSYAARRANHHVMVRGTFASPRLVNEMCPEAPGGSARHASSGLVGSVFEIAERYRAENALLIVIAGKEYGTGSSRDWAAKGTHLLGVRAVVAESIERIHRSNLVGMGVLPLQFPDGVTRLTLGLDGTETFDLAPRERPEARPGDAAIEPGQVFNLVIHRTDGTTFNQPVHSRLDTQLEVDYFLNGGMLAYVLKQALAA